MMSRVSGDRWRSVLLAQLHIAESPVQSKKRSWKSPVAILLIVFVVVFGASTLVRGLLANRALARLANTDTTKVISNWKEIAQTGHNAGSPSSPVTVVVFADYQCVGCAAFHPMLRQAQTELASDLRVVTRHFPLSGHAHAVDAANAAECASEQGRFAEMEDVLYSAQDSIGRATWYFFAARAGVRDSASFERCVKSRKFDATVTRDRTLARSLKFQGTPTYLINGTVHFGAPSQRVLLQQLRDAVSNVRVAQMGARADSASAAASSDTPIAGPPKRHWLDSLRFERSIAGGAGDELLTPGSIAVTRGGELLAFDYGAMELRAFSRDGQQLWRQGAKGGGPGEYRNVMDVEVRSNGAIVLLDMANRRITELSPGGKLRRTVSLKLNSSRFIATSDTSSYTLAGDDTSTLWVSVDANGALARRMAAPPSMLAKHSLAREQFTAAVDTQSVVAYRWSDRLLLLERDGAVKSIIDGVERVALPNIRSYPTKFGKFSGSVARIDPNAVAGTLSVASHEKKIFVLFGGLTPERGRLIDVYEVESARYIGSYLLPTVAQEIAVLPDGSIVALRMEPIPSMDIYRVPRSRLIAGAGK